MVNKKSAFSTQNKAKLCQMLIMTLVFEKTANFFRRNLSKISENCDHNNTSYEKNANFCRRNLSKTAEKLRPQHRPQRPILDFTPRDKL
jgi:hypothetical protein